LSCLHGLFIQKMALGGLSLLTCLLLGMGEAGGGERFEDLQFWNMVRAGKTQDIIRFVEGGRSLNRPDKAGMTPLLYAVRLKNYDMLSYILENDVDVDYAGPTGDTPLMHAVRDGESVMVAMLLESGADIDGQDRYGVTPLMKAVERGDMAMVELLLAKGADISIADYTGRDVLIYAGDQRDKAIYHLLREKNGMAR